MRIGSTDTKNRIIETATELYSKFGLKSVSIDDIANNMGMSKKTIYQYFVDKNELINIATQRYLALEKEALKQFEDQAKNAVHFFIKSNNYFTRNVRDTSSVNIIELKRSHAQAWEIVEHFRNDVLKQAISANLQKGIEQELFRSGLDIEIMSRLRIQEISSLFDDNVFSKRSFDTAIVSNKILEYFIHGISTDVGLKLYKVYK